MSPRQPDHPAMFPRISVKTNVLGHLLGLSKAGCSQGLLRRRQEREQIFTEFYHRRLPVRPTSSMREEAGASGSVSTASDLESVEGRCERCLSYLRNICLTFTMCQTVS